MGSRKGLQRIRNTVISPHSGVKMQRSTGRNRVQEALHATIYRNKDPNHLPGAIRRTLQEAGGVSRCESIRDFARQVVVVAHVMVNGNPVRMSFNLSKGVRS